MICPDIPFWGIVYLTKTQHNPADRPVSGAGCYLARFLGFCLGVKGAGGLFSIARSRSSVRFIPSALGSRSKDSISRFVRCFWLRALFMVWSVRRG